MKFNSIFLLAIVLLSVLALVTCQDDGAKGRANPLLRRAGGRPGAKTSTTTPPPPEEGDVGEEDYYQGEEGEGGEQEQQEQVTTTSSTEPPKKIGPIIRPFRSNDDLLNALRRRQMNVRPGSNKPIRPASTDNEDSKEAAAPGPAPAPASKSSSKDSGSRRRFGGAVKPGPAAHEDDGEGGDVAEEPAPKRPSRFNLRGARS